MSVEITWIHHASFRIASGDEVVYIDPWKMPLAAHDADVVLVSHSHYDHCSQPDIDKVSKDATTLIAPAEAIVQLQAANAATPGDCITVGGVTIETVAAYNVNKAFHPKANNYLGAVITIGGRRIYYAGDTDVIPEMSELSQIDLALLPVGGTYTLNAAEAARACKAVGCTAAVGYHWGDIVGSAADAERFSADAPCQVHLLQPGGSLSM